MTRLRPGPAEAHDIPGYALSAGLCAGAAIGLGEAFVVLASTTPSEYQAIGFGPTIYSAVGAVAGLSLGLVLRMVQRWLRLGRATVWNLVVCLVVFGPGGTVMVSRVSPDLLRLWAPTWIAASIALSVFWMWLGGNLLTKTPLRVLPTRKGTLVAWGGGVSMLWMFALTPPPGLAEEPAPAVMQGPEFAERPNLLIIQIDGLSPGDLTSYGGAGGAFSLDGFANTALVFDQAISAAPDAGGATAALFTSALPPGGPSLPAARTSLAEHLQDVGFVTGGLPNDPDTSGALGFGQGFHWYPFYADFPLGVSESSARLVLFPTVQRLWEGLTGRAAHHQPRSARDQVDRALGFIRANGERRWFLWIELGDLVGAAPDATLPVADDLARPPPSDNTRARRLDALNEPLGLLLSTLNAEGHTLVVIVSSSGNRDAAPAGDPLQSSASGLDDQTLRVPLILRRPGEPLSGLRVPYQVRLVDIAPTLADAALLPPAPGWVGQTLLPDDLPERLMPPPPEDPEDPPVPVSTDWWSSPYSLDALAMARAPAETRVALRRAGLKVVRAVSAGTERWWLHDLLVDPAEVRDVHEDPRRVEMEARLELALPSWTGR